MLCGYYSSVDIVSCCYSRCDSYERYRPFEWSSRCTNRHFVWGCTVNFLGPDIGIPKPYRLWGMEEAVCVIGYKSNPGRIPVTMLPFAPPQIILKGIRNILICPDTWNIILPLPLTVTQRLLFPQLPSNPFMVYRFFEYFYCRPLYGCSIDIDHVRNDEIPPRWDRTFREQKLLH
jgi:hypothetical protein